MSIIPQITVRLSKTAHPYHHQLSDVTGVSFFTGRRAVTDQWQGSSCVVYGRNPEDQDGQPEIGQSVAIEWDGPEIFYGIVRDWRVIYGVTPAYDTWELTLESGWAAAGRSTPSTPPFVNAGNPTYSLANNIVSVAPVNALLVDYTGGVSAWGSHCSAQSYTLVSDALTALMETEQGAVRDWGQTLSNVPRAWTTLYGRNSTALYSQTLTFADDGTADPYTEIEFLSAAYNYGTKVVVNADGLAAQVAGTGDYSQTFSTITYTTSEAANLAAYMLTEFDLATAVPSTLTTTGAQCGSAAETFVAADLVKQQLQVVFRGNTYDCVIEGISFTANPTNWSVTYNLSSSLQNAFLRLDDPVFGTLDNNRLGF